MIVFAIVCSAIMTVSWGWYSSTVYYRCYGTLVSENEVNCVHHTMEFYHSSEDVYWASQ